MDFDVIVVGAGHAGIEAAYATAGMGLKTILITMNYDTIAQMSCNPSIGGIAKGNIVREIDAFSGLMPRIADQTSIQFRMLNTKKGPAVQSLRVQSDKLLYMTEMQKKLLNTENLFLYQDEVCDLIVKNSILKGVKTKRGIEITGKTVILTTGTFLKGKIFIGNYSGSGGRIGEFSSEKLSESLKSFEFELIRLKTGTPARVNKRSINFDLLVEQEEDQEHDFFSLDSYINPINKLKQIKCFIAKTNSKTNAVILKYQKDLPLYSGKIRGIGPRYCPSFEDKVIKFKDKDSHLIFVEQESLSSDTCYLNGISTSLGEEHQYELLNTVPGFENIEIIKPAYAVEYDAINPMQLKNTLESKPIANLYFAGQINGTSGYEEAAGQGLVAGINSGLKILGKEPFIFSRFNSYIGVMIDDLTTKGIDEPYRMFTSRAEFRLNLRFNNYIDRLFPESERIGMLNNEYKKYFEEYREQKALFINTKLREKHPEKELLDFKLKKEGVNPPYTLENMIMQDSIDLIDNKHLFNSFYEMVLKNIQIEVKYKGYIENELQTMENIRKNENYKIPENISYKDIGSLSYETIERLNRIRPGNIGQLSRIRGIKQSDIVAILVYLKSKK